MEHQTITALFESHEDAGKAMKELRRKGFVVSLDVPGRNLPDPDLSVNALMVGFLPDIAHGIFGSDNAENEGKLSAYLFILVDNTHKKEEAGEIIKKHNGRL